LIPISRNTREIVAPNYDAKRVGGGGGGGGGGEGMRRKRGGGERERERGEGRKVLEKPQKTIVLI